MSLAVIPAKAGIQVFSGFMDPRLGGGDDMSELGNSHAVAISKWVLRDRKLFVLR
jgi:hypothetical protein